MNYIITFELLARSKLKVAIGITLNSLFSSVSSLTSIYVGEHSKSTCVWPFLNTFNILSFLIKIRKKKPMPRQEGAPSQIFRIYLRVKDRRTDVSPNDVQENGRWNNGSFHCNITMYWQLLLHRSSFACLASLQVLRIKLGRNHRFPKLKREEERRGV